MAVTASVAKLNSPYSGPFQEGGRTCAYARVTLSGTYLTGGFSMAAAFEDLFGIRWVGQMEIIGIEHTSTMGGNLRVVWTASSQNVTLRDSGGVGDPQEVGNTTDTASTVFDCKIYSQSAGD